MPQRPARLPRARLLRRAACVLALALLALAVGAWLTLRASLPALDGTRHGAGLAGAVVLERDALGALTLAGTQRADLAFALGYAHAQDRWFQMDLMRRAAAGELAALLGPATLATDRALRVHRFRAVAQAALARAGARERELLTAYAAGANAGLAALGARPFEYFVLRADPEPWRAEDSVLVVLAMFLQLQEADAHGKIQRGLVFDALPAAAARFVYAAASDWEAALDGTPSAAPLVPPAADFDLRRLRSWLVAPTRPALERSAAAGSNNFAVAGARTASGAALIANDMHLGLRVPNTWYRARLRLAGPETLDICGVTLPGAPAIVAGSNGHVAWGFTNSYADFQDVVIAVPDPADPSRYLTAAGSQPYSHAREQIRVHGGNTEDLEILATEWGPVIGRDPAGRPLALEWTAHDPQAVNLNLIGLEQAQDVAAALAVAVRAGIPGQNFVVGDAEGHIAWTIAGRIPRRRGGDASVPRLSTDPGVGFDGWLADREVPRLVDPPDGQIVTANARVVGAAELAAIGDGGYDRGVRAGRIAADLAAAGNRLSPGDALAVQLDDTALLMSRWQGLLAQLLDANAVAGHPRRAELKAVLAQFSGHARTDDAAYRLVRAFRVETERRSFAALIAAAAAHAPDFPFRAPASFEGPLWVLVTQRPPQLVPPGFDDWRAFLLAAVDAALDGVASACPKLTRCSWGAANVVTIRHPLARALTGLGWLLDMPAEPLPGDEDMPRVQGPSFGASERFAVSPGHEQQGYFHMPTGQSGHPLSPYFRAGREAWVRGVAAPFLPGAPQHRLTLTP